MSLPTRKDMLGLAERLTNLEMRLDDLEAKLDEVLDLLKSGE
jgi:polyhydroxyalkanoate synthesis regulator phasin